MLSDQELQELLGFTGSEPLLSVYIGTTAADGSSEAVKLRLRSLLKHVDLPEDERVVMEYFEHARDWKGRSMAVFSSAGRGFFKAFPLAVALPSLAHAGSQPYVKPLANLLDAYGGYGVALVDKQAARLFHFHLGELLAEEALAGEPVRHAKQGGASSMPGRRGGTAGQTHYVDEITERNLKTAAEAATRFFSEKGIRRILIGGLDENTAAFRGRLPKAWQSLIVGTFNIPMNAHPDEVLQKALQAGREADRKREARLIEQAVSAAAKGAGGAVRLEDTLAAVNANQVQVLIIREDLQAEGVMCRSCGFATTQMLEQCPYCSGRTERLEDVVEYAVRRVMQAGGTVEIVDRQPDMEKIQAAAILRY